MLTGLLSPQQTTSFKGSYYELTDARCNPKPVQQPHLPIWIGGNGEKRTLRTAARFAQYWSFDGESTEQFSRARDVLHQHCADLGRDPAEIRLCSQVRFAGDPRGDGGSGGGFRRCRRRLRDRQLAAAVHAGRAGAAGDRAVGTVLMRREENSPAHLE